MAFTKASSPFIALLQVRKQFGQSETDLVDVVDKILTTTDFSSGITNQYIGASGKVYKLTQDGSNYIIDTYQQVENALTKIDTITYDHDLTSEVLQDITGVNNLTNVGDILQDLTDGAHFNGIVSELAGSFMGSSRLSISEASAYVTAHNLSSTNDINDLLKLLYQNSVDGKVSNYGFMSLLDTLCKSADDEVSNGALEMDTSSPFIIQGLLATMKAFSSMILSTVLSVISTALRGVIGAVVGVLSVAFQAFSGLGSDLLECDANSSSGLVDGPAQFLSSMIAPIAQSQISLDDDNPIAVQEIGMLDTYIWRQLNSSGQWSGKHNFNTFFNINFDISEFVYQCYDENFFAYRADPDHPHFWFVKVPNLTGPMTRAGCMTLADSLDTMSNPSYATHKLALELLILGAASYWGSQYAYDSGSDTFSVKEISYADPNSGVVYKSLKQEFNEIFSANSTIEGYFRDMQYTWRKFLCQWRTSSSYNRRIDEGIVMALFDLSDANCVEFIQNFYTKIIAEFASKQPSSFNSVVDAAKFTNQIGYINPLTVVHTIFNCDMSDNNIIELNGGWVPFEYTDRLPLDRSYAIPSISHNSVLQATIALAVITVAAAVIGTRTAKTIKKRKFVRQLKEKDKLSTARAAYASNPSQANLDAFYKAQKSYNFKAKLFGWSTYDATNDWFNDASGASAAPTGAANNISNMQVYRLIAGSPS